MAPSKLLLPTSVQKTFQDCRWLLCKTRRSLFPVKVVKAPVCCTNCLFPKSRCEMWGLPLLLTVIKIKILGGEPILPAVPQTSFCSVDTPTPPTPSLSLGTVARSSAKTFCSRPATSGKPPAASLRIIFEEGRLCSAVRSLAQEPRTQPLSREHINTGRVPVYMKAWRSGRGSGAHRATQCSRKFLRAAYFLFFVLLLSRFFRSRKWWKSRGSQGPLLNPLLFSQSPHIPTSTEGPCGYVIQCLLLHCCCFFFYIS